MQNRDFWKDAQLIIQIGTLAGMYLGLWIAIAISYPVWILAVGTMVLNNFLRNK